MVSVFTHLVVGLALGTAFRRDPTPRRFWFAGALGSACPDLDAVGYWAGVPYGHLLGHRGLTHSPAFAAALAATIVACAFPRRVWPHPRAPLWLYLFLAIASHGVLDATTNGGLGVAFLAPFSAERWFLPWRPIWVSPIGVRAFFTPYGLDVLVTEILWVWLPALGFVAGAAVLRRRRGRRPATGS